MEMQAVLAAAHREREARKARKAQLAAPPPLPPMEDQSGSKRTAREGDDEDDEDSCVRAPDPLSDEDNDESLVDRVKRQRQEINDHKMAVACQTEEQAAADKAKKSADEEADDNEKLPSGWWKCPACTLVNEKPLATVCEVCEYRVTKRQKEGKLASK